MVIIILFFLSLEIQQNCFKFIRPLKYRGRFWSGPLIVYCCTSGPRSPCSTSLIDDCMNVSQTKFGQLFQNCIIVSKRSNDQSRVDAANIEVTLEIILQGWSHSQYFGKGGGLLCGMNSIIPTLASSEDRNEQSSSPFHTGHVCRFFSGGGLIQEHLSKWPDDLAHNPKAPKGPGSSPGGNH